jgi:hypothetical protein
MKKNITKYHVKKERDPNKVEMVIKKKGYPSGFLPKGKVLHHIKPVTEGGKTTPKNTRIITVAKHKQIHKNRRKIGKV